MAVPLLAILALAGADLVVKCDRQTPTYLPVAVRRRKPDSRLYVRQKRTPATRALLYLNAGAFVLTSPAVGRVLPSGALFASLAKSDAMIQRGQVHRLATACCLHASVPHLVINSMSLNNLGPTVERWYGSRRFVSAYVLAGIAGNVLSYAMRRAPLAVGASGAIFGLLGAHMVRLLTASDRCF